MFDWPWPDDSNGDFGHALDRRLKHIAFQNDIALYYLDRLTSQGVTVMADLTAITNAVEAEGSVIDSAVTLLGQLSAQLSAVANDPVAVQALADQINTESQTLAAAVVANTPAAPPADGGTPPVDTPPADDGTGITTA